MAHGAPKPVTPPRVPRAKRSRRARSLPSRWPFLQAAIFSAVHFLVLLTCMTAAAAWLVDPQPLAAQVTMWAAGFAAVTGLVSWMRRRSVRCPLCKGTPLANSGALAHGDAVRLFPLNHGMTATLSILATQTFRCMYCGSLFDLLKKPSHSRPAKRN